jgi:hypothetical protein
MNIQPRVADISGETRLIQRRVFPASTPKFGWQNGTHQAIVRSAISRLPENSTKDKSWKKFLKAHEVDILAADELMDVSHSGPPHYFDVSEYGNTTANNRGNLYHTPGLTLWHTAKQTLTKRHMSQVKKQLKTTPLTLETLQSSPSLLEHVGTAYRKLLDSLRAFGNGQPRLAIGQGDDPQVDAAAQKLIKTELFQNIGYLTHLIADASMPLHTASAVGDWPLIPDAKHPRKKLNFKQGIHFFIEKWVFRPSDLKRLLRQADQSNSIEPSSYDKDNLIGLVAQLIQQSYFLLPDIVHNHQYALKTAPIKGQLNRSQLRQVFRTLLTPQLQEASETLSKSLYSIYKNAGEPELF